MNKGGTQDDNLDNLAENEVLDPHVNEDEGSVDGNAREDDQASDKGTLEVNEVSCLVGL